MLGKLFGSNARVKILKLFLLHPQSKFYIRQLARDLKLQVNSVRRELENLEKFGLLISKLGTDSADSQESEPNQSKQEKKYFQVNPDFILLEEIKALIIKAQILYERDFVEKLQKLGKIKMLVLTGIFVNNTVSPVDLLIVGRLNKPKLLTLIKDLQNELGKEINFTLFDPNEFRYRRDITDVFLYNILDGKKMIVIDEYGVI
jgi:hypothetical protein